MSKFFDIQSHHVRLAEIAVIGKVLPEFEDPHKQRESGGYGFEIMLRSGIKIAPVYRSGMINKPSHDLVVSIRASLMAALEGSSDA